MILQNDSVCKGVMKNYKRIKNFHLQTKTKSIQYHPLVRPHQTNSSQWSNLEPSAQAWNHRRMLSMMIKVKPVLRRRRSPTSDDARGQGVICPSQLCRESVPFAGSAPPCLQSRSVCPHADCPRGALWRGALMFSLICTRINGWVNNGEAGDLRRHRAYYDVTVMHVRDMGVVSGCKVLPL